MRKNCTTCGKMMNKLGLISQARLSAELGMERTHICPCELISYSSGEVIHYKSQKEADDAYNHLGWYQTGYGFRLQNFTLSRIVAEDSISYDSVREGWMDADSDLMLEMS